MSSPAFPSSPCVLSSCRKHNPPRQKKKRKKEGHSVSLRTALRISARTWKRRGLFCFVHFSQITEKFVCFVYLHFLLLVQTLHRAPPAAIAVPDRYDCLFSEPLSFVGCGFFFFCFPGSAQEGNLFTLYLQNCA